MADEESVHVFVEPPIPVTTEFTQVSQIRAVIHQLDQGSFRQPALLAERMLWNPRLAAVVRTRLAGLIATRIRFKPRKNNKWQRRAAKQFAVDWPKIAPAAMRKQMLKWSLFLGFGLGQRVRDTTADGRFIPKLRPYWVGFAYWYWAAKCYRVQTFDGGVTPVGAPSIDRKVVESSAYSFLLGNPPPSKSPWVVCEPNGMNSYREALIHSMWRPWFGHDTAMRDQARLSEKTGVGMLGITVPRGSGDEWKKANARLASSLQGSLGSEGVLVMEQQDDLMKQVVAPIEFNGTGGQAISDTLNANAVALAILLLGHNLTTEIKGGGSYAAAGVADYIRDDIKHEDGETEWDYAGPQLAEPWAIWNFDDPEMAPIAEYEVDSPAISLQRAQMINQMAQATALLRANLPKIDLERLAEEFDLPLLPDGVTVPVAAPLPGTTPPPGKDSSAADGEPTPEPETP